MMHPPLSFVRSRAAALLSADVITGVSRETKHVLSGHPAAVAGGPLSGPITSIGRRSLFHVKRKSTCLSPQGHVNPREGTSPEDSSRVPGAAELEASAEDVGMSTVGDSCTIASCTMDYLVVSPSEPRHGWPGFPVVGHGHCTKHVIRVWGLCGGPASESSGSRLLM